MVMMKRPIDPSMPVVKAAPPAKPPVVAPAPAAPVTNAAPQGESRLQQQQRYLDNMWSQLGQDARLASIMFNPIFMVQAQAITDAAVAKAIHRYETEVPQKDFSVLYNEEMGTARKAILGLPALYAQYGQQALQTTGQALLDAYDTTTTAVATAAEYTGKAAKTGVMAVFGVFAAGFMGLMHGIGHMLHGLGGLLTGAGGKLESVGN